MLETHTTHDTEYHLTNDLTERRFIGEMLVFFGSLEADEDIRKVYADLFKYIATPGAEGTITKIKLGHYIVNNILRIKKLKHYKNAILFDFVEVFFGGLKTGIKFNTIFFKSLVANSKNNALKKLCDKIYLTYAIRYIQTGRELHYKCLIDNFSETFIGKRIGIDKQKSELFLVMLDEYKTDIRHSNYVSLIRKSYSLSKTDDQRKEILLHVGYGLLEEQLAVLKKQSTTEICFLRYSELLKNIALLKIHIVKNRGITKKLERIEKDVLGTRVRIAANFILSTIKELEKIKQRNSGWRGWLSRQWIWHLFFPNATLLSQEQLTTCNSCIGKLYNVYANVYVSSTFDGLHGDIANIQAMLSVNHPSISSRLVNLIRSIAKVQLLSGFPVKDEDFLCGIIIDSLKSKFDELQSLMPDLEDKIEIYQNELSNFFTMSLQQQAEVLKNVLKFIAVFNSNSNSNTLPKGVKNLLHEIHTECVLLRKSIHITQINQDLLEARKKIKAEDQTTAAALWDKAAIAGGTVASVAGYGAKALKNTAQVVVDTGFGIATSVANTATAGVGALSSGVQAVKTRINGIACFSSAYGVLANKLGLFTPVDSHSIGNSKIEDSVVTPG